MIKIIYKRCRTSNQTSEEIGLSANITIIKVIIIIKVNYDSASWNCFSANSDEYEQYYSYGIFRVKLISMGIKPQHSVGTRYLLISGISNNLWRLGTICDIMRSFATTFHNAIEPFAAISIPNSLNERPRNMLRKYLI